MKGYSKINENNLFFLRSKSKKEYAFLDQDVDLRLATPPKQPKNDRPTPTKDIDLDIKIINSCNNNKYNNDKNKKDDVHACKNNGEKMGLGGALRRNFSVSAATTSSYQKNKGLNNVTPLERQGSTRSIQGAVKRVFSMRRSSSVNNSDRYCRIYDQPMTFDDYDADHVYDYGFGDCDHNNYNHKNDECDESYNNGSMETRSKSNIKKDQQANCKKDVRSKVVKACKRLFSR